MECISCGYPLAGPHYACGHCAKIARIAELETSLKEINEIRNSIVGLQTVNWSEHIYPLVASLDKAGMVGMEYPEARGKFGTAVERAVAAETERAQLRKQLADLREKPAAEVVEALLKAMELVQAERDGPMDEIRPRAIAIGWLEGECEVETFIELTIEDAIEQARAALSAQSARGSN